MVEFDTTPASDLPAGIYLVEVKSCKLEYAKSDGSPMFHVVLASPDHNGDEVCHDWIMLGGKGKGMGMSKLKALGFTIPEKTKISIENYELLSKRVFVHVVTDEWTDRNGETKVRLKLTKRDSDSPFYWPDGPAPSGYIGPIDSSAGGKDDPWIEPQTTAPKPIDDGAPF